MNCRAELLRKTTGRAGTMPTTVVPAPDVAALAVTLLSEVTIDSPAECAWVPAYAAPQG
jgi:hypothetical protein